ncbi:hypothetical protein JCM17844_00080 [Iodidimonas gelatinilytica]|uniref:Uncharacterized protein n=1 Tax=Iodidimonas gelatinilytica TaxID=1236966 RepID=A0A5A7MK52_9PROT|nr:hypothetical protein [Iodidimonas gelatinilytica]GEQ96371.1 hypothetical protein JCM17844_00080 [Iodidimonas gelatinilytica]GER00306.1 hypothetical protein JCM17845_09290 [Iodidimonas gelatinilytica]
MTEKQSGPAPDNHWLVRPSTIRILWILFIAMLAATVVAQLFVEPHASFGIDGWLGFAAVFGFSSCALMVVVAKLLGYILKRPEGHYDD